MTQPYLETTFRHGRPVAAYYYLPRVANQRSERSRRVEPGLIIAFAADDQAIGIESTTPSMVSLEALNAVLLELGQSRPLTPISPRCSRPECATLPGLSDLAPVRL